MVLSSIERFDLRVCALPLLLRFPLHLLEELIQMALNVGFSPVPCLRLREGLGENAIFHPALNRIVGDPKDGAEIRLRQDPQEFEALMDLSIDLWRHSKTSCAGTAPMRRGGTTSVILVYRIRGEVCYHRGSLV
jgi:hypothetical protein